MKTTKKVCKSCQIEKDLYSFDKVSKNGYRGTCRKCRSEKNTSSYLSKEGNLEKRKEYNREYQKKHRLSNEYYIIYQKSSWQIRSIINRIKTGSNLSPYDLIVKEHMENQFTPEMSWETYGDVWEVDHIISATRLAKAGYSPDEINKLSNLRPLTKKENRGRNKENRSEID